MLPRLNRGTLLGVPPTTLTSSGPLLPSKGFTTCYGFLDGTGGGSESSVDITGLFFFMGLFFFFLSSSEFEFPGSDPPPPPPHPP